MDKLITQTLPYKRIDNYGDYFLERARKFTEEGLNRDEKGEYETALQNYMYSIEYFLESRKYVTSAKIVDQIRKQLSHIVERAEVVKNMIESTSNKFRTSHIFLPNPSIAHYMTSNLTGFHRISKSLIKIATQSQKYSLSGTRITSFDTSPSGFLVNNMQRGLDISMKFQSDHNSILMDDFSVVQEAEFISSNGETVQFEYIAPFVFQKIREMFSISDNEFKSSLLLEKALTELKSPGKSASFFYITLDHRFLIKTITTEEVNHFQLMLPAYFYYLLQSPDTLISKFYGFYSLIVDNKKMYFIVMESVFYPGYDLSACYDLKGSTHGRFATEEEKKRGNVIFKDLDVMKGSFQLNADDKNDLIKQIHKDCWFLETNNVMDYSLLVGMHPIGPNSLKLGKPGKTLATRHYGGIMSRCGRYLYFFGIIDILTDYNMRKFLETTWKSLFIDEEKISAVNPCLYRERFEHFVFDYCIQ